MSHRWRVALAFAALFVLYQSAEGVGDLLLHRFAVQAGLMIACLLAAWPLSRWLGWKGYGAYALPWQPAGGLVWLAGGFLLTIMAKVAAVAVGLRLGVYASHSGGLSWNQPSAGALGLLVAGTFVASLAEDILTRGFWYRAAGIRWRLGWVFVTCSSVIYVLNHIYRLGLGPGQWGMLFCFGLLYATALWRSGSLWAALGFHWGWNLANGLLAVDTLDVHRSELLSSLVHVVLLLIVLAVPVRRRECDSGPTHA